MTFSLMYRTKNGESCLLIWHLMMTTGWMIATGAATWATYWWSHDSGLVLVPWLGLAAWIAAYTAIALLGRRS